MKEKIVEFRPDEELIRKYKGLLRDRDWSLASLQTALQIFETLLHEAKLFIQFPWEPTPKKQRDTYPIPPAASTDVRHFLELMNERAIREASEQEQSSARWTEHRKLDERIWLALVAEWMMRQSSLRPGGNVGFFHDLQSLIFQTAVLHWLPIRERAIHRRLETAMLGFCHLTWSRDPPHADMLRALLAEELSEFEIAESALRNAIAETPPTAHDYLTKVQSLWSLLIEQHRHGEAFALVLKTYREAPRQLADEVAELIRETTILELAYVDSHRPRRKA